jgi:hypothetical protein
VRGLTVERRMGQKCRVMQYQVTAHHSPALLELIDLALAHCHYQDGPFGLDRQGIGSRCGSGSATRLPAIGSSWTGCAACPR